MKIKAKAMRQKVKSGKSTQKKIEYDVEDEYRD